MRVAKANIVFEFSVAYVFVVTLSVFPPITTAIMPTNPKTHPLLFSAIHFLVFNTGDFLGRYACAFPRLRIWSDRRLLTLSLARTLFIPLFLLCNVNGSSSLPHTTPIINSDFLFMLIVASLGVSGGYVSSSIVIASASLDHNPKLKGRSEDVSAAATVSQFCLIGGLAIGSVASFAVRAAVCGCNPFVE